MPELPEVENVRRGLLAAVGASVAAVRIYRRGVVTGRCTPQTLLAGAIIRGIERHGKELLILTDERAIGIHLGMTGNVRYQRPEEGKGGRWKAEGGKSQPPNPKRQPPASRDRHIHVIWQLADGATISFRDPRRFGGIWTFADGQQAKSRRWGKIGPDACEITAADLGRRLARTKRAIKAALLDQRVLAGVGNIYADEVLFACRINPNTPAHRLTAAQVRLLVTRLRRILARAIAAGGSSVRDYTDGHGQRGRYQNFHRVYGRGGKPCVICRVALRAERIGGRTSTYCPSCQPCA
jgi:formamidopyrimidine-DNA glycosylase